MDDLLKDKKSAEYQWLRWLGSQKVEDFMWRSTDHGPEWSEKEIKEAVKYFCKNLKRIERNTAAKGGDGEYLKDCDTKTTKKKLIEYIKKNI